MWNHDWKLCILQWPLITHIKSASQQSMDPVIGLETVDFHWIARQLLCNWTKLEFPKFFPSWSAGTTCSRRSAVTFPPFFAQEVKIGLLPFPRGRNSLSTCISCITCIILSFWQKPSFTAVAKIWDFGHRWHSGCGSPNVKKKSWFFAGKKEFAVKKYSQSCL